MKIGIALVLVAWSAILLTQGSSAQAAEAFLIFFSFLVSYMVGHQLKAQS